MDLQKRFRCFVVHSIEIHLVEHKEIVDFHTILVHHYVVDHCYSVINSFNIRLKFEIIKTKTLNVNNKTKKKIEFETTKAKNGATELCFSYGE